VIDAMVPETSAVVAATIGATGMACAAVAVIFVRSWRRTRDALFAFFAAAFAMMAVNRALLAIVGEARETVTALYAVRLAAFLLILAGIVVKNASPRR
jgi:hypothetical protein